MQRLVVTLCNFVTLWTIAGSRRELLRERHAAAALQLAAMRRGWEHLLLTLLLALS